MLSSQFFSWTAMKCDLQLNGNILFNSTSEIPMVRSGRKEAATQRIQQMVFSHSEWIPAFCPDLYALINSWIDPSRKHCLLPTWSFKVIAVACSLLGKSEMPWVSFARQTRLFPSHKDLRVQSRLCQNQPAEINREKTISQHWVSATLLSD